MSRRSLRLRLFGGAAIAIALALVIAGLGIAFLFERHVSRRVDAGDASPKRTPNSAI